MAQNPTKTQIYQPMVYVGLGGHASYPDGRSTNYDIKNPEQIGSTSHLWTGIEYHRGGNDINLRGKVEYLPRVGKGINTKEIQGKEWLLYPRTWGNPKNCSTKWLDFGCPGAHQGPVFISEFIKESSKLMLAMLMRLVFPLCLKVIADLVSWLNVRNPTQPTVTFLTSTQLLNCQQKCFILIKFSQRTKP